MGLSQYLAVFEWMHKRKEAGVSLPLVILISFALNPPGPKTYNFI